MALAFLLAACSSTPPPSTAPADGAEPDLGLRPGDAVRVQVWREDDLSGVSTIDDRGVVTLPLLGDREVAGLAPGELRDELLVDYREYLQNPSIEVTVLRRINILGAVTQPGLYSVDATISLSEALGLAGGITPEGDADDIRLYRDDRVINRDLDRNVLVSDVDIRSGDRVVVGEKNWFERNPGALIGSLLAAAAGITVALIR
jgi:polysaccharide export outer membrane protein